MTALRVSCTILALIAFADPTWAFEISSPAVSADMKIPDKYTANSFGCSGQNVSLPLTWKNVPVGTKSLGLTMYDPDAPSGGFWHWEVVNIPVSTTSLSEDAGAADNAKLPAGAVQARNDAGSTAYFGPCPPKGNKPHRYIFTIFALKTDKLDVGPDTSGAVVGSRLRSNTLATANVTFTYGRK